MEQRRKQFSVGLASVALVSTLLIQNILFTPHPTTLSYSDFKALVTAGKVTDRTLEDRPLFGRLRPDGLDGLLPSEKLAELRRSGKGEHQFVTVRVDDPTLVRDLESAKVRFTGRVESTWLATLLSWILPALIFVALW